ncbi:MAG: lactate utilization protein [Desulfuromonadaceae bacterium]
MAAAEKVGAAVCLVDNAEAVAAYIADRIAGPLLVAPSPSLERMVFNDKLQQAGLEVVTEGLRNHGPAAAAGLTGANFGIATTGTVVLESTPESVRLATTLPEKHFVVLDPVKIVDNELQVALLLERFHQQLPQLFLAYLTGPSRTADIERVLTIGVHGPKELHILLLSGLSDDPLEC